jgi:hypothetical protein
MSFKMQAYSKHKHAVFILSMCSIPDIENFNVAVSRTEVTQYKIMRSNKHGDKQIRI